MPKPPWAGGEGAIPTITGFSDDSGTLNDGLTNDNTITLIGTSDPNIEVRIYADGVLLGTTRADASGNWTFTTASLADGRYSFTAEIGNGGNTKSSDPVTVDIDTVTSAPEITSAVDVPGGVLLTGTAEAGASVNVFRDGSLLGTITADASGVWTIVDGTYEGGSVTYTAFSTDTAGNTAGTASGFDFPPPPNAAPTITSVAAVSLAENQTAVLDVAASDDSDAEGAGLAYSISGGADAALFSIDAATGALAFRAAPDFEAPGDADTDNVYHVQVTVTDSGGLTGVQDIAVTVTDAAENAAPTIFETRIASSADDAEERPSGSLTLTSSDLELTLDGTRQQIVGIRFTNIDIPQGAIITNAYIQFQTDEVSTGGASLLIAGEDSDDAAVFVDVDFNISVRLTTDASVSWTPPDWTTRGEAGLAQRTPDLAAIIQEIVLRDGWAALNDMAFIITGIGSRVAESFDGSAAAAPLLHIEWLPPAPASDPVVFATPPDTDAATNQIAELASAPTAVGITTSASDPDADDTVIYSINDARFLIDTTTGVITRSGIGTLDFETEPSVTLTVTATSSDGSKAYESYTLAVLDEQEPVSFGIPPDADAAANRITETAAAGTAVGITASANDDDAGDFVTFSIDDERFTIDSNGVITRSATGALDHAAEPSVTLTVTATSSDGSSASQPFTLNVVPDEPQVLFTFAVFGDYGDGGAGEAAVAALVNSWNVDFILTAGDNAYGSIAFDDAVGQFFSNYIGNYKGSYGSGSEINRFFPTLGDGDYDDVSGGPNGGIDTYLDYFTLPDNERYYDFQAGSVHFFALNSDSNEPDGHTVGSTQAQWLDATAAASDAMFKVAYFHHTPYTPAGDGDADLRWGFEAVGVDALFAGHRHHYYRVMRDDNGDGVELPYITTGMGGVGNTSPSSVGANLVTVTDAGMLIDFYLADGTLVDSCFVDAPTGGNPLFVNGNDVINGSANSDYLWGIGGNDTLTGFAGDDMLIGGDGDDHFIFNVGDGQDVIADFMPGAGTDDMLDLRAHGIDTAEEFRQVATNQGSDVVVDLGNGDRITLLGVQLDQFHDDDFLHDVLLV